MKEQTVEGSAPGVETRQAVAALQKALLPALFVALALLVTTGYGGGVQLNDGLPALHIDPLQFLGQLLHMWNPALALGFHTGFFVPYQMPYSWFYGLAQILHVPQDLAQHAAVFFVYLCCLWSMYYCLRSVAPWLDEVARIAGSVAYLFNMYVALNSQAQIVWLLTYATLPAMVGVTARAMRGEMNIWRAALAIALLVLAGGGVNPPLLGINVIVLAIFVVVTLALDPKPGVALNRALPLIAVTSIAAFAINLYWLVPFVDYFRGVWLNGVLSEAPSMHNASTSFANVLRGLGHWATFVSFAGRAYFPWAFAYASGVFGALLWFVPVVALGGIAFKRNQRPVTLFFLLVTIVSVPIVVGYYHGALGDAVTTPIYDQFYRNFPGFQMFRFSYKWVAGVEFGLCGLYALGGFAAIATLREQTSRLTLRGRERWGWLVVAVRTLVVAVPILAFVPVLINKMNYPGAALPPWEFRENALVGANQGQRVALFPTQFLEQFDWGSPQFYIENSLIDRPMIYGLLGSEPSAGSDVWVRRAYRAAREGLPFSADMLRVMGVDTILQRDDFIPAIDFSSPGEWRFNSTTLTHDLIARVIGASPADSDGPVRIYHLSGALPLFYGVTHPVVSTLPTFSEGFLGDVAAMARGRAQFSPPSRSAGEFASAMQALSPILPANADGLEDLAVNQALIHGIRVQPSSADAQWLTSFEVKTAGTYAAFALDQGLLYDRPPPKTLEIDGNILPVIRSGGAWTRFAGMFLSPGKHWVSDGYVDPDLVVALVNLDDLGSWEKQIAALQRQLPNNLSTTKLVYAPKARFIVATPGRYRVTATAVGQYGPDGVVRTRLIRGSAYRGAFPANLGETLPYVFGDGIVATSQTMMPARWYSDDPTAYQWQRGDPASWFLFARDAHVRVFVPGSNGVRAQVAMRVSRLQVSELMSVAVRAGAAKSVILPGPSAADQQYDSVDNLDGPVPVPVRFELDLHPGWNDISFDFHSRNGDGSDLGSREISAAVAPDLTFVRRGAVRAAQSPRSDVSFTTVALEKPPSALAGDPEILGSIASPPSREAGLVVALAHKGSLLYRVFPFASGGPFDVYFMHAFPNNWNDGSLRVVGLWLFARGSQPKYAGLYYRVHGLPSQNLRRPESLAAPPLFVDHRPVGAGPLFLSRGRHVVASADRQVKIGLLRIVPLKLRPTADFGLTWQRHSPTSITVTAPNASNAFLLVFNEAYHPEWRATLDGQALPHVIVNGVANGWIVPNIAPGSSITLTFAGQGYYIIAGAISALALIILIVLAWSPELWPITATKR
ncbi:MAG: alpha-(1-_3)-arabinofuranosyltransferase family protein [Candidatus Cybelea sp.]